MKSLLSIFLSLLLLCLPGQQNVLAQETQDRDWLYNDTIAEPVTMMSELLVTPDGSDPVSYILDNVAKRARQNRKRLNYQAYADVQLIVRDADIIPQVMPKTLMFLGQLYLRSKGMWSLFKYATSRPSVQATLRTNHSCKSGRVKYGKGEILTGPADMKKKVGNQLLEICQFNLFDEIYGSNTIVDADYRKKFDITFVGSTEENGQIIFVLKARRKHGELRETQTLHVIDKQWGILRAEYSSRIFRSYRECKDIGGGIYMPWRKVDNPVQFDLDTAIDKARKMLENKKKVRNMERKTLQRAEKLAKGERQYKPMIKMGYEIRYSN